VKHAEHRGPEVRFEEVSHSTHRDWSRVNVVVLTDTSECPTAARHNFVSHEYYVFMTPLVSFRQRIAKGRSFSYFRDVDRQPMLKHSVKNRMLYPSDVID
jgi:hypothetical protein